MHVRKGHGTENDFVVVHDEFGSLELSDRLVVGLCDRRAGVGADGLLRVVRTSALENNDPLVAAAPDSQWFMDYRNADATLAEMCGNGVRVVARHLADLGLVDIDQPLLVGTRGGTRLVRFIDDLISVELGQVSWGRDDIQVTTEVGAVAARQVWMPNPHAVAVTDDLAVAGKLVQAPVVTPAGAFPDGVNVEIAELVGPGRVRLRVHERGVGETRSCGTGVGAAAAVAARAAAARGWGRIDEWDVRVPGGDLKVILGDDDRVTLIGPAVMVADITLTEEWLATRA